MAAALNDKTGKKFKQLHKNTTHSRAIFKDMDQMQFKGVRLAVVIIIILVFLYNIPNSEKSQKVLSAGECIRDQLFVWSSDVNAYF